MRRTTASPSTNSNPSSNTTPTAMVLRPASRLPPPPPASRSAHSFPLLLCANKSRLPSHVVHLHLLQWRERVRIYLCAFPTHPPSVMRLTSAVCTLHAALCCTTATPARPTTSRFRTATCFCLIWAQSTTGTHTTSHRPSFFLANANPFRLSLVYFADMRQTSLARTRRTANSPKTKKLYHFPALSRLHFACCVWCDRPNWC